MTTRPVEPRLLRQVKMRLAHGELRCSGYRHGDPSWRGSERTRLASADKRLALSLADGSRFLRGGALWSSPGFRGSQSHLPASVGSVRSPGPVHVLDSDANEFCPSLARAGTPAQHRRLMDDPPAMIRRGDKA